MTVLTSCASEVERFVRNETHAAGWWRQLVVQRVKNSDRPFVRDAGCVYVVLVAAFGELIGQINWITLALNKANAGITLKTSPAQ